MQSERRSGPPGLAPRPNRTRSRWEGDVGESPGRSRGWDRRLRCQEPAPVTLPCSRPILGAVPIPATTRFCCVPRPGPFCALTSLRAAHPSPSSYRASCRILFPSTLVGPILPHPRPPAVPTPSVCKPLSLSASVTRNRNPCRYLRVRTPPSLCCPTGVRTSGHPSIRSSWGRR